jgi:hypothetical protein
MRVAMLPPPGLYGGGIVFGAQAYDFTDGQGQPIVALSEAKLGRLTGGPFAVYVPHVQPLGGSVGFAAFFPMGRQCGRLFAGTPQICQAGLGDPYIEAMWSRSFATPRPSRYAGALPIFEGLTVAFSFGAVVPIGKYDATDPTTRALSSGSNIWDFAPSVAVTYVTPPILAEGTEFSAKLYWNSYRTNPDTQYRTGALVNTDFAITERIGRFQLGVTGFYAFQVEDDTINGVPVPPDGQRVTLLSLGGVLGYDMPEIGAAMKIKGIRSVVARNTANSHAVAIGLIKKLQ